MIRVLSASTRLSELRQFEQVSSKEGMVRLARSVEQSLRVEGYPVSEQDVLQGAVQLLKNRSEK